MFDNYISDTDMNENLCDFFIISCCNNISSISCMRIIDHISWGIDCTYQQLEFNISINIFHKDQITTFDRENKNTNNGLKTKIVHHTLIEYMPL